MQEQMSEIVRWIAMQQLNHYWMISRSVDPNHRLQFQMQRLRGWEAWPQAHLDENFKSINIC